MPRTVLGQWITFAVHQAADEKFTKYRHIRAKHHQTPAMIAAQYGHSEGAKTLVNLNPKVLDIHKHKLRHVYQKLKGGTRLRIPGSWVPGDVVHVLADDPPPVVTDGYAQYDTVSVAGRRGISRFNGYNPYALSIPVQWESWQDGNGQIIEESIRKLEKMCGVGLYAGARSGPPAVIKIQVTDNHGNIVPLIAPTYQWTKGGGSNITWRIAGIAWDGTPSRTYSPTSRYGDDPGGRRVRQKAVVSVVEYTPIIVVEKSVSKRSNDRNGHGSNKGSH